jgi:hypothetical protein
MGAFISYLGVWHERRSRKRRMRMTTSRDLLPIALGVAAVGVGAFIIGAIA